MVKLDMLRQFWLKILIASAGIFIALVLIGVFILQKEKSKCNNCNVILVSIDTLRADHLGVYGYKENTSPNIDTLAKGSLVFDNYFSAAPWTLPSHAALFTSDYPSNIKVQTLTDKLHHLQPTIASVLAQNGYITQGFDQGFNFVSSRWGLTNGFQNFNMGKNINDDASTLFPLAEKWVVQNKSKKFFLFLHTFQVHDPYCPEAQFDKFDKNYNGELNCIGIDTISKFANGEMKLSKEDENRMISLYDGDISDTDFYLGNFLRKISNLGLYKNTIIIITADHGEEFGERGHWGKHGITLFNETIKVPLIIKVPNQKPGRSQEILSNIDIAPSILGLLGIKAPFSFKGVSYKKVPSGRPIFSENASITYNVHDHKDEPKTIEELYKSFSEIKPFERNKPIPRTELAVIYDGWKYIKYYNSNSASELYNLTLDPSEKNNLTKLYPSMVSQMNKFILEDMN